MRTGRPNPCEGTAAAASIDETHGEVGTATPQLVNSLTFTGFDQWCDIAELIEIAARARPLRIEWAVLAGTSTGNDPRFPDLETIARFRDRTAAAGTAAALHLCGRLARAVAAGDLDEDAPARGRQGSATHNSPEQKEPPMAKSLTPTLRQRLANADRLRLKERADGRESMRRLVQRSITPPLERIKWALAQDPPRLDIVRDRIDALLCTIADKHAQLDALDSVDRERASTLPEGPKLHH